VNATSGAFADPVHDAQRTFRTLLDAVSHPGIAYTIDTLASSGVTWQPALAAAALTLFDRDTPVWYDPAISSDVRQWLRFHTASPVATAHGLAQFAIVAGAHDAWMLSAFDGGTLEFPERSATVLIAVDRFAGGMPVELRGPGIDGAVRIAPASLDAPFWNAWQQNAARFPCGVDVLLFEPQRVMGLPRTARVEFAP
jgi:alpha-D-ribose 1-methylphosphonate 5-triphosphate synthase subunit PhnH